jgi:hypothetical protein
VNKTIFNSLTAVSIATFSYFSTVNSASAATLVGQFQFDGADKPNTTMTLSKTSFTFAPNPGQFNLKTGSATGTFASEGFTRGRIQGPVTVGSNSGPNPFFDLGTSAAASITDNKNIFKIAQVSNYTFTQNLLTKLWTGSIGFTGIFTGNNKTEVSDGAGELTFQLSDSQKQSFDKGNNVTKVAFSGISIAADKKAVPESSSVLGLAALGLVGTIAVARKTKKLEM